MKYAFRVALSIGVSFAILALLLQTFTVGVAEGQRPNVFATLQATALSLVLVYLALYLVALLIRAYRYRLLLRIAGEANVPSFGQMVLATGVRNMLVDMLPARIGELGYVALLNRGYGVALSHSTSSLTISIAFDLIAVFFIFLLIALKQLFFVGELQTWTTVALLSALGLCVIAVIGLFFITPYIGRFLSRCSKQSARQPHRWLEKGLQLLEEFSQSLLAVRGAGYTGQVLILSLTIRILKYLGLYFLFRAVSDPSFPLIAELPMEQVVSALIGGELGASLPVPTFMSFGIYEAGAALIFQILGVTHQAAAVVTMLCVHIWSQVMDYTIGGALLVLFILLQHRVTDSSRAVVKWVGLGGAAVVFLLGSSFLALELRAAKKLGALSAPSSGQASANLGQWKKLSQAHLSKLNGFVVFSSNRDGNHDIFKLNFADFTLSKLTEHEHTETYPRISPDGKRIVFSRAHQPWVSQRNLVAWDIYLLDLATGIERRLGSNGTAAQWLDNDRISFLQDANKVVQIDLNNLKTHILFQPGMDNSMPVGSQIHDPKINPVTGQIVFTAKQSHIGINSGHWGTAITIGNQVKGLYEGCELSWSSDGKRLFQVSKGGRDDGLKLIWVDPVSFATQTMVDLEGEFNHEYWPKDSANGEYVVFGASRGPQEHEHDTQDYELFLWRAGSDTSKATRLTFHTGNDNWPDIFLSN